MREIKFRGKRLENGEWIYGDLAHDWNKDTHIIKFDCFGPDFTACGDCGCNEANSFEVDSETVGQFAGLKDKNGKEIYEGDIVNLINADGDSINVICEFGTARREIFENTVDITGFYFKLSNGRKTFPIVSNYLGKHDLELFKIIGNIHDNP